MQEVNVNTEMQYKRYNNQINVNAHSYSDFIYFYSLKHFS